ncbi:MAG: hypothetical protein K6T63_08700 [Alicyclobacillus herbarius]|uniref:hypothetical protein n=1 Tax=Alicyclobacillus herbarius TaxID=122960 RepID=UPI0003F85598|nr:hypothetical protein [Alicyclobacillus herbarius]MCL6632701.1 hypothetical protein [Alicyclobacillus herbarius]
MNEPTILNAICQECGSYGSQKCPLCIVEIQRQKLVVAAMMKQLAQNGVLRRSG